MFLAFTSIAYAAVYTIYSNVTTDVVASEYVFGIMTKDTAGGDRYTNVTFTGQLLIGAAGAPSKTVLLMRNSPDNSTLVQVASGVTSSTGYFQFIVNRTEVGTYYYKARFDAP